MYKKLSISLVFLVLISLTGCTSSLKTLTARPLAVAGNEYSVNRIVDHSEGSLPTEMIVYKVIPYQYNEETVQSIAQSLGIDGTAQDHGSFYRINEGIRTFMVDKYSGSYTFMYEMPIEEMVLPLDEKMSDEDYIILANQVIEETGIAREGLDENPVVFDHCKVSYVDDTTGEEVEITILKGVNYRYNELDGIRVEGVAPRLTIALNADGDVVEIFNPWSYFEKYDVYPLISKNTALDILKNPDGQHATVLGLGVDDTFTIDSIRVVYYNDPVGYESLYLMPFFCMEGTNSLGEPVTAYVRAVDPSYIQVEVAPINQDNPDNPKRTEFPETEIAPTQGTGKETSPEVEQEAAGGHNE